MEGDETEEYINLKTKPQLLLKLVDTFVKVSLIKNISYSGYLLSIDPITYSIILSVPNEELLNETMLLPGYAILDISETEHPPSCNPPCRKEETPLTETEITEKRVKLMSWFKCNLLPVSEDGGLINLGNVHVLPPYSSTDICTDNPVIALQIKAIMDKMPEDYKL